MSFKKNKKAIVNKNILLNKGVEKDVTFYNAKNTPIHRWFPYLEGFDERFIFNSISALNQNPKVIYEPFAGAGTVPIFALKNEIDVFFDEVNPFLNRLIELKKKALRLTVNKRKTIKNKVEFLFQDFEKTVNDQYENEDLLKSYYKTFKKSVYFNNDNFKHILKIRTYIDTLDSDVKDIFEIATCESLLPCSRLKRAGDIRFKRGKELDQIDKLIPRVKEKVTLIIDDIANLNKKHKSCLFEFYENSKIYKPKYKNSTDIIVTSPPYLNGTNYIRNTKLELWFLGYLKEQKDLNKFRSEVVTAGINDVSSEIKDLIQIPIISDKLKDEKLWYDKRIPKMANDYFNDMHLVLSNCIEYLKPGAFILIDIGDSIYGGQHIPTDLILIEISKNIGFIFIDNIELRSRRSNNGQLLKQTLIICQKKK